MFLWYLAFLPCIAEASKPGICAMNGCNCTVKAHRWINVKCVFSKEQVNARTHARPAAYDAVITDQFIGIEAIYYYLRLSLPRRNS
jgi:hypothetical protein